MSLTDAQVDARLVELSTRIDEMLADPDMPQAEQMNVACELFMIAKRARQRLAEVERERDGAYAQRNRLAILLASLFGGRVMPANPQEPGWSSVLAFDLWTGQVTFHLKDSEIEGALSCPGVRRSDVNDWDGHDDAEKWDRIARAACSALEFPVASATALAAEQARTKALREALVGIVSECQRADYREDLGDVDYAKARAALGVCEKCGGHGTHDGLPHEDEQGVPGCSACEGWGWPLAAPSPQDALRSLLEQAWDAGFVERGIAEATGKVFDREVHASTRTEAVDRVLKEAGHV